MNAIKYLVFYVVNMLDYISTYLGITNYGIKEANPLIRYLLPNWELLLLIKIGIVLYAGYIFWVSEKSLKTKRTQQIGDLLITILILVVINNFILISL